MIATGCREAAQLDERGQQSPTPDVVRGARSFRRTTRIEADAEQDAGDQE